MMSDGTGEVPMGKLTDGQGRTKRVGGLVNFNFDELTSLFFGVAEVKFLSPEDAERIKAG